METIYNITLSGQYYICGRMIPVKAGDRVVVKENGEILVNGIFFTKVNKN